MKFYESFLVTVVLIVTMVTAQQSTKCLNPDLKTDDPAYKDLQPCSDKLLASYKTSFDKCAVLINTAGFACAKCLDGYQADWTCHFKWMKGANAACSLCIPSETPKGLESVDSASTENTSSTMVASVGLLAVTGAIFTWLM
jgi:hypothetical protein